MTNTVINTHNIESKKLKNIKENKTMKKITLDEKTISTISTTVAQAVATALLQLQQEVAPKAKAKVAKPKTTKTTKSKTTTKKTAVKAKALDKKEFIATTVLVEEGKTRRGKKSAYLILKDKEGTTHKVGMVYISSARGIDFGTTMALFFKNDFVDTLSKNNLKFALAGMAKLAGISEKAAKIVYDCRQEPQSVSILKLEK